MAVKIRFVFLFALIFATAYADQRLRFIFYQSPTQTQEYNVQNFNTILNHPGFLGDKELVMFHYGEGQSLSTPEVLDVVNSYAGNTGYNFVLIHYFSSNVISTGNAVELAEGISTAITNLLESLYPAEFVNLVGFGLGGQIVGRASRRVQQQSDRRFVLGRITALNPLQMGNIATNNIGRLAPGDAAFVETIFTETNQHGDFGSRGDVWFMVNGGASQPVCDFTLPGNRADCSHLLVLNIWAESVRAISPVFPALACNAWTQFLAGTCNNNPITHMGRSNTLSTARGSYILQTNNQPPWSRTSALPATVA